MNQFISNLASHYQSELIDKIQQVDESHQELVKLMNERVNYYSSHNHKLKRLGDKIFD